MLVNLEQEMLENIIKQPGIWKRIINQITHHQVGIDRFRLYNKCFYFALPKELEFLRNDMTAISKMYQMNQVTGHAPQSESEKAETIVVKFDNETQIITMTSMESVLTISMVDLGSDSHQPFTVYLTSWIIIMLLILVEQHDFDQIAYQIAVASEDCERFFHHSFDEFLKTYESFIKTTKTKERTWIAENQDKSLISYYQMQNTETNPRFMLLEKTNQNKKNNALILNVYDCTITGNSITLGNLPFEHHKGFAISAYLLKSFIIQIIASFAYAKSEEY